MKVAGLVPFTTIDYPGALAAVIFFKGCPLRCPFCHNPDLQQPDSDTATLSWPEITAFLETHRRKLDGIVLSGGEPLMQEGILEIARQIKQFDFKIAVHTSGVYPEKLAALLPLVDWVGLDIKSPFSKYETATGRDKMAPAVQKSLDILLASGTDFECRTTCDPRFLTQSDLWEIAAFLHQKGVKHYVLQKYRSFDKEINPPSVSQIESLVRDSDIMQQIKKLYPTLFVRG